MYEIIVDHSNYCSRPDEKKKWKQEKIREHRSETLALELCVLDHLRFFHDIEK